METLVFEKGAETTPQVLYKPDWNPVLHGDLERDTSGRLRPRYAYAVHHVGELVCGDLVQEPVLGPVVADAVTRCPPFVHVQWADTSPCTAVARYASDVGLRIRGPTRADRLLVRQGVDQAAYKRQDIAPSVARLIAAHLHRGPQSELYRFAIDGALSDGLFTELDGVARDGRQDLRAWAVALARHCVSREDPGPVPGWLPVPEATGVERQIAAASAPVPQVDSRWMTNATYPDLLSRTYIRTETALQLLDAAFALGTAACRLPDLAMALTRLGHQTPPEAVTAPWNNETVVNGRAVRRAA